MMTVGQHDTAWLDVMGNRIPNMDHNLMILTKYVRLHTMLEYLDKSKELGFHSEDEYRRDFKKLAEDIGFIFPNEDSTEQSLR